MIAYDARNNRLEIINLLENRKRYIPCLGINPETEKVIGADAFGDEIRVRAVPKVGCNVGTGIVRLVKYSLSQATEDPGTRRSAEAPMPVGHNPFGSRDPTTAAFSNPLKRIPRPAQARNE
jgi:hypothetical protein